LSGRREELQRHIAAREEVLQKIIPIAVRVAVYPLETLLAANVPAEDAATGLIVLKSMARQAAIELRALKADRDGLDVEISALESVAPHARAIEAARAADAEIMAMKISLTRDRREASEKEAAIAARQAEAEAARAMNLGSMLSILDTQRKLSEEQAREDQLKAARDQKINEAEAARLRQAETARAAGVETIAADAKPAGQVTPPVHGILVRGWGQSENGEPATGQSWRSDPGAPVLAPCGGTVAFAEPFRDYGLLVIIDCGGGYHAVLSGMEKINVSAGKIIRNGDQVGTMQLAAKAAVNGDPPGAPGSMVSGGPPILYFELRKGGHPVDPAPWLKLPG
jgi:septal ring factor EnvC (AmiA/AmiB activator)